MMLTLMLAQDNFTTDMWSPYVWETILLWQKGKRLTKNGKGIISSTSQESGKPSFGNDRVSKYGSILQWVANSHIAVQSHEHEHPRLHTCEPMDKAHLG
jgi:hypothetical protein